MRRRRSGAFGGRSQAHLHGPLGHIDDLFARDDRVNLVDDAPVVGFQLVIGNGLCLQRLDHLPVVGRVDALGLGHQRRKLLHDCAGFHELQLRALHQQRRIDVDAVLLQLIGIQLGWQPCIGARLGQDLAAAPVVVVPDLFFHRIQGRLGAGNPVLCEQFAHPGDIGVAVADCAFQFNPAGLQEFTVGEFFFVALTGQRGQCSAIRGHAHVSFQPIQRLGAPLRAGLVGEQAVDAVEDGLRRVAPRQQVLFVECAAFDVLVGGLDHYLQILAHVAVTFELKPGLQLIAGLGGGFAITARIVRAQIGHLVVVAGYAKEAGVLGLKCALCLQQDLRVAVAGFHPRRRRPGHGGGRSGLGKGRQGGEQGQCNSKNKGLHGWHSRRSKCTDPTRSSICGQCAGGHASAPEDPTQWGLSVLRVLCLAPQI